ncbi:MAG: hypothetical protein F6J86_43765 [Symploca sp. SIO1B1]|nr:hypothetical protein [Symploca sp. SIO1C2]NES00625.1 hypothetical protein [Symploca sp. SIO1B1]
MEEYKMEILNNNLPQAQQFTVSIELVKSNQELIDVDIIWIQGTPNPAEIMLALAVLVNSFTRLTKVLMPLFRKKPHDNSE